MNTISAYVHLLRDGAMTVQTQGADGLAAITLIHIDGNVVTWFDRATLESEPQIAKAHQRRVGQQIEQAATSLERLGERVSWLIAAAWVAGGATGALANIDNYVVALISAGLGVALGATTAVARRWITKTLLRAVFRWLMKRASEDPKLWAISGAHPSAAPRSSPPAG